MVAHDYVYPEWATGAGCDVDFQAFAAGLGDREINDACDPVRVYRELVEEEDFLNGNADGQRVGHHYDWRTTDGIAQVFMQRRDHCG